MPTHPEPAAEPELDHDLERVKVRNDLVAYGKAFLYRGRRLDPRYVVPVHPRPISDMPVGDCSSARRR